MAVQIWVLFLFNNSPSLVAEGNYRYLSNASFKKSAGRPRWETCHRCGG